jgi:hypothetical protein
MIPQERKSVRVPRDDPSREEECNRFQEIVPLERKSVMAPRDDPSEEEECKGSKR